MGVVAVELANVTCEVNYCLGEGRCQEEAVALVQRKVDELMHVLRN
jgi:hypothetical protein